MFNFQGFLPDVPSIYTTIVFYLSVGGLLLSFLGLFLGFFFNKKLGHITDKLKLIGFSIVLVSLVFYTSVLSYLTIIYFI